MMRCSLDQRQFQLGEHLDATLRSSSEWQGDGSI